MANPWVIHGLGALVSIVFIVLSIYATCRISYFTLPIPTFASVLAILLSFTTYPGLLVARNLRLSSKKSWQQAFWAAVLPYILLALNTALLTLSADRAASPSFQSCSLHERWLQLFQNKDSRAIRRIQDSMECCGFRNSHDMAWPFPDNQHRADSCEVSFGRTVGCEGAWTAEGRRVMAIMAVVGGVGIVSVILFLPVVWEFRTPWLRPRAESSGRRLLTDSSDAHVTVPYADDPEEGQEAPPRLENGERGVPVDQERNHA